QLDHARSLRLAKNEHIWLAGNTFYGAKQIFEPAFMEWLANFRLPDYELVRRDGQYELRFEGLWADTTMWEIPAPAIINDLRENFIGTSNVKHAMDTGLEAIGTNAHELPMVYAALTDSDAALRDAPYEVLRDWAKIYGGNLLVVLPDCFGTTAFLEQAPDWV